MESAEINAEITTSSEENEEQMIIKSTNEQHSNDNKFKKIKNNFLESDSDNEPDNDQQFTEESAQICDEQPRSCKPKRIIVDSDSENEDNCNQEPIDKAAVLTKLNSAIIESDCENEYEVQLDIQDKIEKDLNSRVVEKDDIESGSNENINVFTETNNIRIAASDSEEDLNEELAPKVVHSDSTKGSKKRVVNSDSENEDSNNSEDDLQNDDLGHLGEEQTFEENYENSSIRKPTNLKEAIAQRKEIHSESQRMLRESRVSLPYHVPKPRTLKEFLNKRPKFAIDIPNNFAKRVPASVAIKMSKIQLEVISKKLEEREKEVENFYKSDSENEEDKQQNACESTPIEGEKEAENSATNLELGINNRELEKSALDSRIIINESVAVNDNAELSNQETNIQSKHLSIEVEVEKDNDEKLDNSKEGSFEYDFDLKDVDSDDEEITTSDGKVDQLLQKYGTFETEEDKENAPDNSSNVNKTVVLKKADLLKEKLNCQPRLSGGPDQLIDLDEGIAKPSGVSKLMERYMKHVARNVPHKHEVHLSVLNVENGEVHKEQINVTIDADDVTVVDEKPGLKLKKLREELQNQMAQRRSEQWQQKIKDLQDIEAKTNEEKDILDDDEEEFLLEEEDEDYENEDNEGSTESESDDDLEQGEGDINKIGSDEDNIDEKEDAQNETKKLKRIIKGFEDSDDEDNERTIIQQSTVAGNAEEDDDKISPNRIRENLTPIKHTENKRDFSFMTPVDCLTGLQGFTSQTSFLHESPSTYVVPSPSLETSISREIGTSASTSTQRITKNLFDSESITQNNDIEDLADLCSGRFSTPVVFSSHETVENSENSQSQMNTLSLSEDVIENSENLDQQKETNDLNDTMLVVPKDGQNQEKFLSIDDSEEKLITELLDEEEMELFKKKFDSPKLASSESQAGGGIIYDSSDDDEATPHVKKKNMKKLNFSDDESSDDSVEEPEEVVDLRDVDDEEKEEYEVDYDSEENEIDHGASEPKRKMNLGDFIEKEAELSGSEWGSDDEDERNLDSYDVELGDKDRFDDAKLRSDLEKIHTRAVLDEDQREIKLLQEILLEDGELHGAGRQRQFRWKNIDSLNDEETVKKDDDDDLYDDVDNNTELVKMRHEREVFLRRAKEDADETVMVAEASQILQLGRKVSKSATNSEPATNAPAKSEPFTLTNQKGSFLNRNEAVLRRIAEYTQANQATSGGKASRNFVFHTVEAEETNVKKRKAAPDGTPKAIKKFRVGNNTKQLSEL